MRAEGSHDMTQWFFVQGPQTPELPLAITSKAPIPAPGRTLAHLAGSVCD